MLRFINEDGGALSTKIVETETGRDVTGDLMIAYGAKLIIGAGGIQAELELLMVPLDVVAGKVIWGTKNPNTQDVQPIRAIEFSDGTRVEFSASGGINTSAPSAEGSLDVVDAGGTQGRRPHGGRAIQEASLNQHNGLLASGRPVKASCDL